MANMNWTVLFHDAFDAEFRALSEGLQDELLAHAKLLAEFGPNLADQPLIASRALNTPT